MNSTMKNMNFIVRRKETYRFPCSSPHRWLVIDFYLPFYYARCTALQIDRSEIRLPGDQRNGTRHFEVSLIDYN